jgi:hypothetical protein
VGSSAFDLVSLARDWPPSAANLKKKKKKKKKKDPGLASLAGQRHRSIKGSACRRLCILAGV